jgi:simple sugar transport system permease protein
VDNEQGITLVFLVSIGASMLRLSTPLVLGALGGYASERGGIVNIALEGLMLMGAFFGAVGAHAAHSPWAGLALGCSAAVATAMLHGFLCIRLKADPIISGIAINCVAIGLPPVVAKALYDFSGGTPQLDSVATMPHWDWGSPLLWFALAAAVAMTFIHRGHRFGQHLRFAGEHPEALESQGISVARTQWKGLVLCGLLCGLAGAYLSIDHGTAFSRNMTAGRGFIALAALIVGRHTPYGAAIAALGFGAVEAVQILLQGSNTGLPVQWLQLLPYAATLGILASGLGRRR